MHLFIYDSNCTGTHYEYIKNTLKTYDVREAKKKIDSQSKSNRVFHQFGKGYVQDLEIGRNNYDN